MANSSQLNYLARMTDPPEADGDSLGTSSLEFSDIYLADGAVIYLGLDQDVTLTHTADTGLHLNDGMKLGFRDQGGEYIYSVSDGNLGIAAGTSIDLLSSIIDIGTSSTSDVTINLLGSTNSMALQYDESTNKLAFDTSVLVVDGASNRVGIGTASPTYDLDISGTINATAIRLGGTALTFSAAEINVIDGDTSATATTIADADRVVLNDDGTMVQAAVTDLDTYFSATTKTLTNKTLTSPVLNTGISGTAIKDEDDMTSDSATHLATQQSIKAYVDGAVKTEEEIEDFVGGMLTGNTETLITVTYEDSDGTIDFVVDNDLSNYDNSSSGFITATLTQEQVEDYAGGMFSGNTETLITATYQDADGTIDLVVDNNLANYDNSSSGFITATLTQEQVEDYAGAMFSGNTETLIAATYDDASGKINLVVDNDLSNYDNSSSAFLTSAITQEQVEDYVGAMFSGNTETLISATYDDSDGTIDLVVDNNLTNYDNSSSGFITATLTQEQVEDYAGGMFSGNTETLITATYQDADGTIDLVVDNDLSNYDNSSSGFITATLTQEQVEDYAGAMFSGNTETLIAATYDDASGKINLVVDNDLSNYDNSSSGFISATPSTLSVSGDFSADTNTLHVDSSANRVGVGTADPAQLLHVYSNNNNSDPSVIIDNDNAGGACGIGFMSGVSDNYTIGVAKVGTNFRITSSHNTADSHAIVDIDRDYSNMGIGTHGSADTTSVLELSSTTQGFLPPRMSGTERDAITSPATGLMIYNTTSSKINIYIGSGWMALTDESA